MNSAHPAARDCIRARPASAVVDRIVVHTMEGTFLGTLAWFATPGRTPPTAAHYLVSRGGDICQMVPDRSLCFHAAGWNARSIGIEHEGYARDPSWPAELLDASAKVAAVLCRKFRIPVDRVHIVGHSEVPGADHTDPGAGWPWDDYLGRVQLYMDGMNGERA